ncbi:hypothetical protein PSTT_09616, partial [Puccinia striiformis]
MAFWKEAVEKLKDVQSTSIEQFGEPRFNDQHAYYPTTDLSSGGAANNQGRFIIRNPATAQLEVEGTGEVVRFASLCAPALFDNEGWEKEDTMRTISHFGKWPVTRTYTLKIKSTRIGKGHINGWDPEAEDFLYDESMFISIDHTIALAAKYNVRLIIPIINQDYGSEDTNWVGNFSDLIRHRRGSRQDSEGQDWWKDGECLDSMKKIVSFLLNRRIGDDPTILAFETGNEMNFGGKRPAPGEWTLEIARHIKNLAPRALVMDGSFARTDETPHRHDLQALHSELVDIISYHYFGHGDTRFVEHDVKAAREHGTVFVVVEYGFLASAQQFESFLKDCDRQGVSGTLAWSLHGEEFTWKGVAWADYYELWTNLCREGDNEWKSLSELTDNIKAGHLKHSCANILKLKDCAMLLLAMRGISPDKLPGPFSKPLRIGR